MANIIIADDHPIVVEGITNIIVQMPEHRIVAVCGNAQELNAALTNTSCDLLLLDINLPDASGIDLCAIIKKKTPHLFVLAISSHNEGPIIARMMENGANGYVLKNSTANEIKTAIATILAGQEYLSDDAKIALQKLEPATWETLPKITRREKEIIQLIGQGKSTVDISALLFISPHTVESHRKNLLEKFNVKSTSAVFKLASDYKLI